MAETVNVVRYGYRRVCDSCGLTEEHEAAPSTTVTWTNDWKTLAVLEGDDVRIRLVCSRLCAEVLTTQVLDALYPLV